MKFQRNKYSSVDGSTKTRWSYAIETGQEFYIEATRSGVTLHGTVEFESVSDLDAFAKALSAAWKDHLAYKPKVHLEGTH